MTLEQLQYENTGEKVKEEEDLMREGTQGVRG